MAEGKFEVRPAKPDDIGEVAKLAAVMVRMHHAWDPQRFAIFREPIEEGYGNWLSQELQNRKALVMVAVKTARGKSKVLGYAYARLEGRDYNRLMDACGFLHDIVVAEEARGSGVGEAILEGVAEWMTQRGAPRLILETAAANETAQRFFRKRGFRPTMIEMARELPKPPGLFDDA
jgi:ribosomal protein S18 acetylase RimI-like enzyme